MLYYFVDRRRAGEVVGRNWLLENRVAKSAGEYLALYRQARSFQPEITRINLRRMPILLCYFIFAFCTNLIFNQWLGDSPIEPKEWVFIGITLLFLVLYLCCTFGKIKNEPARKYIYLAYWTASNFYLLFFIGMDIIAFHTVYNYLLGMFLLAIVPLLSPLQAFLAIAVDMSLAIVLSTISGNNEMLIPFILGSSFFALIISAKEFFSFLRITLVHRHLTEVGERDKLTGLYNRNILDSRVTEQSCRCHENGWPLAAAMVDIDCFKNYNDTFGHVLGDRCLEKVAHCITQAAQSELCVRYGGEEFLIFFVNPSDAHMVAVLEDIQRRMKELNLEAGRGSAYPTVTVSIGVASAIPDAMGSLDALINDADSKLYEAKNRGRSRVCGL